MFLYLSKKISMPNGLRVSSLSWNSEQGWLACGGETGLLKVLKLEPRASTEGKRSPFAAAPSNLSMNQTLEGHHGTVLAVNWNQNYRKLTSSDEKGLIIVWVLHKGMWFEEMINNRDKSVVRDLRWSSDGQKICIVYEDGHVVLGNVDGNRLWGKTLDIQLHLVEWSPDSRLILFCSAQGTCQIHDLRGNFVAHVPIRFSERDFAPTALIVAIDWYNGLEGYSDPDAPTLALAFQLGKIQLMRHELDEEPILLELQVMITSIKWSPDGEVLGVVGSDASTNAIASSCIVQLFSHTGTLLRTLRVPGTSASALSWEGGGLRLSLAVDSYIYLANIRPEYKWAFFGTGTCVYSFTKRDHSDHSVMFWDIGTCERYCKSVNQLIALCAAGEYCILATLGEELGQYALILCNAIGSPVDSKHVKTQPLHVAMNTAYVFVASEFHVYMWNYCPKSTPSSTRVADKASDANLVASLENTFHIDDDFFHRAGKGMLSEDLQKATADKICCVCCSDKFLMVGRESGALHCYDILGLRQVGKEHLNCKPHAIELNCDSSRLSVIDTSGMLYFYEVLKPREVIEKQGASVRHIKKVSNFERKDVWNIKWADDNPDLLAVMEKARMYILRGTEPEEPVSCTAYLCSFNDLQIQAIHLDDVMHRPEEPGSEHIFIHETKSLRDTQQMLSAVDIQDAYSYVEEHSHPRLWISLANHALETLDLSYAEKAFVKCQNYYGIRFVKSLHALKDKSMQKAEICLYFKRDKEAEQIYDSMDRKDLVIDMRTKLGDWIILEKLLEVEGGGNDSLLELTWNNIGDYHADRQNWDKAAVYFSKAKNWEKLADCLYALGDWEALGALLASLPQGSALYLSLAKKFANVGICKHAVSAFVEGGNLKAALDTCVDLNRWDIGVNLAAIHGQSQYVESAMGKHTTHLLQSGNPMLAVQVHMQGGQPLEAAKLLVQLARQMVAIKASPIVVKKLYVLAALQADAGRAAFDIKQPLLEIGKLCTEMTHLACKPGIVDHDASSSLNSFFENAWHGAEAYHFWLLAHRELYARHFDQAMKVSWWLRNYEDILDIADIYSLIALTSFLNKHYLYCSKAISKLESLSHIQQKQQKMFSQLALSIFTRYRPTNPCKATTQCCKRCNTPIRDFQVKCSSSTCKSIFSICIGTGNVIVDEPSLQCSVCKHHLIISKLQQYQFCPLCHSPIEYTNSTSI